MPHPDKRAALGILTVKRLGALCDAFEIERAEATRKDDLIDLLARSRRASFEGVLALLKRDELKEICRASDLDVSGKEKETYVARILGRDPAASPPPAPQTELPGLPPPPPASAAPAPQKPTASLSTTIKAIQDIMRKDVGVDGDAQRIGQLVWLLFLKIWDDREQELELMEKGFTSPLVDVTWIDVAGKTRTTEDLRWRTWAANPEGDTGDKLLLFVNDTLFAALKGMEPGPSSRSPAAEALRRRRALVKAVFEDAYQYMKSGTLLRQVVNKVQEAIDFNDSRSRHVFGDIYEQVLRDLQGAGNAGEYYTPRALTQFAVDMIDPRLGEVVLDPACGTGGFLACAIEHIRGRDVKTPEHEATLQANIQGVEKKPLPHLLCTTNMIVHGIDVPSGIRHGNTLDRPLRDYTAKDRVHVIITNPPFGGMEQDGIEGNFPAEFRTRETADLFLVLIVELLKDGGRAAVVLPDGTLFGEGVKSRIKERLLTECDLHTIVRLPKGVFAPYTSIQTNILFFTKGRPTRDVWYYEHPYPPGAKSYSKTKPLRIDEFAPEKSWWTDRKETRQAWKVSLADIKARGFNLDSKNPNAPSATHEDPDTLLARYEQAKAAAAEIREQLRKALTEALEGRG
jgi:type I restriction enzyme M protein